MKKILEDLYLIEVIGSANVFLLNSNNGFILVDSGLFKHTHKLLDELETNSFPISELQTIVLTHCHCDHIGGVTELVQLSGAKVAAHIDDIPYIRQQDIIRGAYHNMMLEEQKVMRQFHCNIEQVDIVLKDGDTIDVIGGLQVIQVPGHTPGSIALYGAKQQIMFFGDVIRNNPKKGLTVGIPENFNVDTKQTIFDAHKLLQYPIEYALFSHGDPIIDNTGPILQKLMKA
jgi:glyoxylase-like metal-dependent hydrolase (beta-lactamase superfamily II)